MTPYHFSVLLLPALVIGAFAFAVSMWVTRNALFAYIIALVKCVLFVGYFGILFDGTYTFLDDITYLEAGKELLARGIGITSLIDEWETVLAISRGDHFAYYLYNAYAFRLFGVGYYAPVACNIVLTIAVAALGARLARSELGLSRHHARALYVFIALHPDILAWSTVLNAKDTLVLLLHVLLLQAVALMFRGERNKGVLLGGVVCICLTFVRMYVPLMFAAAWVAASVMATRGNRHLFRLVFGGVLLAAAAWALEGHLEYAVGVLRETLVNPVYGFVRILLTPIPFNTDVESAFLDVPALIHWMLLPFMFIGVRAVWRMGTPFTRFFLSYVLVFVLLYAVVGELQGPRHRVQLDFAIAVLQFVGVLTATGWLRLPVGIRRRRPRRRDQVVSPA